MWMLVPLLGACVAHVASQRLVSLCVYLHECMDLWRGDSRPLCPPPFSHALSSLVPGRKRPSIGLWSCPVHSPRLYMYAPLLALPFFLPHPACMYDVHRPRGAASFAIWTHDPRVVRPPQAPNQWYTPLSVLSKLSLCNPNVYMHRSPLAGRLSLCSIRYIQLAWQKNCLGPHLSKGLKNYMQWKNRLMMKVMITLQGCRRQTG